MSDFKPTTMDEIESSGTRYGWSSISFNNLISKFDISRFPDFENQAEPYLCYIIMSRPDLNYRAYDRMRSLPMTAAFVNDAYGYSLFKSMTNQSRNRYLPIITSRAISYSATDVQIKTVDKGNTFFGHMIKYGKHSEDHKVAGTFTIDFRNDRFLSILKMMYIWMEYIYIVSRTGDIAPKEEYQENGILDYPASLYYLVMRRDNRELVYWEKIVGLFPLTAPFGMFSFSDDFILQDRISIEFAYGIRCEPCDPSILMDINYLSGLSSSAINNRVLYTPNQARGGLFVNDPFVKNMGIENIAFANSREVPAKGNALASYPFIHVWKQSNEFSSTKTLKYYLDWIK